MLTPQQISALARNIWMLPDEMTQTPHIIERILSEILTLLDTPTPDHADTATESAKAFRREVAEIEELIDQDLKGLFGQALIQVLAGQRETSRKLDELLNPNRQAHGEHCHSEVITMKGVFTVTFTVEPGTPPPLEVASPEDLGQVGGPLEVPALQISGGTPPYAVALDPSSGPLPPGVSMDSSGNLTGTPTQAGSFNVVVDVSDSLETGSLASGTAAKPPTPGFGPAHGQ